MNIKLFRLSKEYDHNVDIVFIDDDTKEIAGHCKYYINDSIGYIYDTYLFPEYRNKKILKSHINTILHDIKQSGAEKVLLSTLNDEAIVIWEKLGFKKINKNNMEMNIKDKAFEHNNTSKFENRGDYKNIEELSKLYDYLENDL